MRQYILYARDFPKKKEIYMWPYYTIRRELHTFSWTMLWILWSIIRILATPIRNMFVSMFRNVVSDNLKSLF